MDNPNQTLGIVLTSLGVLLTFVLPILFAPKKIKLDTQGKNYDQRHHEQLEAATANQAKKIGMILFLMGGISFLIAGVYFLTR